VTPQSYEAALQAWATAALQGLGTTGGTTVLVVHESQTAPRIEGRSPYVTVRVLSLVALGLPELRAAALDGEAEGTFVEEIVTHYDGEAEFTVYGVGALRLAAVLEQAVGRRELRRVGNSAQLVVRASAEGPQDGTGRRGAGFEERATITLPFGWQMRRSVDALALAEATVSGTLDDGTGEVEDTFVVDLEED
jgi:hypothetical protein